jgi:hypothetical protein
MPTLQMVEPIARAVLLELQANLPAKIAALAPAFAPQLPMAAPLEYVVGPSEFLLGFPVVAVRLLGLRGLNEDLRWQDHEKRIEIELYVQHPAKAELEVLVDRYALALLQTLHERRKAGAFVLAGRDFDLVFKEADVDYSSTYPQGGLWVRALFLPLRATRRDTEYA